MGLLYVFPVSQDEEGFYIKDSTKVTLKSYGLPYIFWIYALLILIVIALMFFAIKDPILKLISLGDEVDALLGQSLLAFIASLPLFILGFFFYEKQIIKDDQQLFIKHRIFSIKILESKYVLENEDVFEVQPFLPSPNIARLKSDSSSLGFQNKGYFVLYLVKKSGPQYALDRHSRKVDLEKLKMLLLDS